MPIHQTALYGNRPADVTLAARGMTTRALFVEHRLHVSARLRFARAHRKGSEITFLGGVQTRAMRSRSAFMTQAALLLRRIRGIGIHASMRVCHGLITALPAVTRNARLLPVRGIEKIFVDKNLLPCLHRRRRAASAFARFAGDGIFHGERAQGDFMGMARGAIRFF